MNHERPPGSASAGCTGGPTPDCALVGVGMAAVAAVVLWAWLDKESFGSVSSPISVGAEQLRLAVRGGCRCVAVSGARVQPLRADRTRLPRLVAGVREPRLDRDDVQCRNGHRRDVPRRRRTAHPLPGTAPASGVRPESAAAAATALEYSFFHWTLNPWAICAIAGLALAYAGFRKGRGNRLSAAFMPLIGTERAEARPGKVTDLLAVSPPSSAPPPALARSHFRARKGSTSRRASGPHGPPNS